MEDHSVLKLEGITADQWIDRGKSFVENELYDEAVKCYSRALKLDPSDQDTWNSMGLAYFDLGEYDGAISCYDKAIQINSNDKSVWSNKALALHYLGNYSAAIDCLDTALDLDPRNPMTWSNKGIALFHMGKFKDAIQCYDKALEIDPEFRGVKSRKRKALDKLDEQSAMGFEKAHNYVKAAELYEKLEKWEDAGRCRELLRKHRLEELGMQQTKIDIGKIEKLGDTVSTNIQDSVVTKSNIVPKSKKKFKICPYCGEGLDFPEPPRFCPYCEKRVLG
jgi:tetratricopeptide (TPR) repeat protein